VSWKPKLLAERVAALGRELRARETELLRALLVAPGSHRVRELQRRVVTMQDALAVQLERLELLDAAAENAVARRPRRQKPRHHEIAQGTTAQDIERARAAMRRQGMIPR
jgi:hypothetical protein